MARTKVRAMARSSARAGPVGYSMARGILWLGLVLEVGQD